MQTTVLRRLLAGVAITIMPAGAMATDLEVTHWWTSGGEAAAVRELARIFEEKTGNTWVDGAIAGSGDTARPIMISRILGGDPMGATQLNHGRQAQELIEAGMMLDITDVAEANNWREIINPPSLLDGCTVDGRIYCAPLNIHSPQWMWTSPAAFEAAGVAPATNWEELKAAAPAMREAGKLPFAQGMQGWQHLNLLFTLISGLGSKDLYLAAFQDKDEAVLTGPEMAAVFAELATARELAAGGNLTDWNLATARVINGEAGAQIMGDWAQGEFAVAGKVAGTDYDCFIGAGGNPVISTAGDAIYFPLNKDEAVTEAQKQLAAAIVSPEAQVAFNSQKGSLPVRGDIDLGQVGSCTQKGLQALAEGNVVPSGDQLLSPDTAGQLRDLLSDFFGTDMSPEDAQAQFADIVASDM